jgi:alpha/beta superfamily hydrolase
MIGRFLAGNLFIPGPAGQLEAIYKPAESASSAGPRAAVVCHPHPAFEGTMHNKVVYRAAKALGEAGFATLRFNFRGVGRSEGAYDEGRGEREDVRAAIDWVAAEHPDAEIVVAGFSFGAWTGLPVGCADTRVSRLVGIGTPVRAYQLTELLSCYKPKLFVHGTLDEHGPMAQMNSWYADLPEPKRIVRVEGADHFFEGYLDELMAAIRDYFRD